MITLPFYTNDDVKVFQLTSFSFPTLVNCKNVYSTSYNFKPSKAEKAKRKINA